MVHKTLIMALAAAHRRDAEERARREAKDDFKGRFRMIFGKLQAVGGEPTDGANPPGPPDPPADETIWEDSEDETPERLPDDARVDGPPEKPPEKPTKRPTKKASKTQAKPKPKGAAKKKGRGK